MLLNRSRRLTWLPLLAVVLSIIPWQPVGASTKVGAPQRQQRPAQDNTIDQDGLGHDSQNTLYRTPFGAQPADSLVTLRFRTLHDDAERVLLRTFHTGLQSEALYPLEPIARNVDCYAPDLASACDFWQTTINVNEPGTLYYRFEVLDGDAILYYEDDSEARDGGWGAAFAESPDWSWAISVYDANAAVPLQWMKEGIVYQIMPDRFRNADPANDPPAQADNERLSTDPRYTYPTGEAATGRPPEHDQIVRMPWGEKPEGYCRNYGNLRADACEPRFAQPGDEREQPRGRDFYGGDLLGVTQKLDYLKGLGVSVIYFNPVFAAGSNHRYDTRDYQVIDTYLGDLGDWQTLVREAQARGMRVILDGVFNQMSTDSPFFDRYRRWGNTVPTGMPSTLPQKMYAPFGATSSNGTPLIGAGACEDTNSPYRPWFRFRPPEPGERMLCEPQTADGPSSYASWAGYDTLAQLSEDQTIRDYTLGINNSVAQYWLDQGASGWRLSMMQDKSLQFWREFRQRVKATNPEAIIVGDQWRKSDVLPYIDGMTADTTMNYRLRDAVIGLLAPGAFDSKGFPDSGEPITPSAFAARVLSIREDYPDATFYTMMNLLGSHETERLLWTLTPGTENTGQRERNTANLAQGKQRQRLAALIQMTMPGAPTLYYGDEVGLTGDDDPDNRQTYPWGDVGGDARQPDQQMLGYYTSLTTLRRGNNALINGDLRMLVADDQTDVVAYGRKAANDAAIVVLNTSDRAREITVPVGGFLPNRTALRGAAGCIEASAINVVEAGTITVSLDPLCSAVLTTIDADLTPPDAPVDVAATANGLAVEVSWSAGAGATGYTIHRSPVSGGGFVKIADAPADAITFLDASPELVSGQRYFYVAKAIDGAGNESFGSNEASAVPAYAIGDARILGPPTINYTISAAETTEPIVSQVLIERATSQRGPTPNLIAQVGYGPADTDPRSWTTWADMEFVRNVGNNEEYRLVLQPTVPGPYRYVARYSTNGGDLWTYGDLDGAGDGSFAQQTNQLGTLDVQPSADQEPPVAPANLQAASSSATSIRLNWEAVNDPSLVAYTIYRTSVISDELLKVGTVEAQTTTFNDTRLQTGVTHSYVVRAVDQGNNLSLVSNNASAAPQPLPIEVTFEVTVPRGTPANQTVYLVGNQPELCGWCEQQNIALARGEDGKYRVTLTLTEGTPVEYTYTLGTWETVEKDAECGEVSNRQRRISADKDAKQVIGSRVAAWNGIGTCER